MNKKTAKFLFLQGVVGGLVTFYITESIQLAVIWGIVCMLVWWLITKGVGE